jgi:hypothetical protein
MSLPNGSIANLSVARKSLKASNDKKLRRRALDLRRALTHSASPSAENAATTGSVRRE